MGITKTEGFTERITLMADILKVMGNPARLSIIEYLAASPSCICNDLVDELPLAQPTVSRHLAELKRVGLIKGEIKGKNVCYCLDASKLADVRSFMSDLDETLSQSNSCC